MVLFVRHTSTLFSFHRWSSLPKIHIISSYKGLTVEIPDEEGKKKKRTLFFFFVLAIGKPYTNNFD